ncbi:hypothetical protein KTC96_23105 (plasmid) [Clostridium estertheticum]|uniref:hypothetical protein n=1 Tax=Clostridium estertheticum TaxID=238834 RepID=UPI001C7DD738|nr:hypothetical protein [Clostridium estertheticum]MBX4260318.1 hypothetical protein [Clostridium estertheticum]WLC72789.1 hypothetical protein KTC96_23105 [Clostridium estertheticum]
MTSQFKLIIILFIIGIIILIGGIATKKKWLMLISAIPFVISLGVIVIFFIALAILPRVS